MVTIVVYIAVNEYSKYFISIGSGTKAGDLSNTKLEWHSMMVDDDTGFRKEKYYGIGFVYSAPTWKNEFGCLWVIWPRIFACNYIPKAP